MTGQCTEQCKQIVYFSRLLHFTLKYYIPMMDFGSPPYVNGIIVLCKNSALYFCTFMYYNDVIIDRTWPHELHRRTSISR